jgi:hypothetical protein
MPSPYLIGAGAGLISAILFASAATGTPIALLLFYLTALPLFLGGLGWGAVTAMIAGLAGTVALGLVLGGLAAASYAISIAAPVAALCYLALLSRPVAEEPGAAQGVEWYPVGRLVASATILAGLVSALLVIAVGYDAETYRETIGKIIQEGLVQNSEGTAAPVSDEAVERISTLLAHALPAAFAMVWLGITLLNMWTAGRIIEASGRALRPWPQIDQMEYPGYLLLLFAGTLLLSFAPGQLGLVATAPAGALFLAYVLLGLCVIHAFTRGVSMRGLWLAVIYFGLLIFGWLAVVIAIIGVGEPMFRLRDRGAERDT